jgi:hypothetical protein
MALESTWLYGDYEHIVEEALSFHCPTCNASDLLKLQLSQLYHQGYVVIESIAVAVSVTSVLSVLERISDIGNGRGKLRSISDQVGFKVLHTHLGQSSFIVENWTNHAKRTKLQDQELNMETMYQSLIESISKDYKTGEWVVCSKHNESVTIWGLWLHEAGDEALVRELKART